MLKKEGIISYITLIILLLYINDLILRLLMLYYMYNFNNYSLNIKQLGKD